MVIGKILCPLWGRILYLQQGLMQQFYLLLMLAVDTCNLRKLVNYLELLYAFYFSFDFGHAFNF
jgi:hypothetical protein